MRNLKKIVYKKLNNNKKKTIHKIKIKKIKFKIKK